jgi:hypothetical protein
VCAQDLAGKTVGVRVPPFRTNILGPTLFLVLGRPQFCAGPARPELQDFNTSTPCDSRQLGNPSGLVPIRHEDVCLEIDEASVRCAEHGGIDRVRIKVVLRPLRFLRIIANEGDRNIVSVKNRGASFQFRNHSIVAVKAHLARSTKMLGNRAYVAAIQIEMAETAILTITDQKKRLIVARVE